MSSAIERVGLGAAALLVAVLSTSCAAQARTVSLKVAGNVPRATVTIDDIRLGALAYVQAHGVALPPGPHHITIEAEGYFPVDRIVEAKDAPIVLQVELRRLPE